jgi:redox-sensitive bicupin YhaK (pirin superfamily)
VHFLQIWILPERSGIAPGYEQKRFAFDESSGLTLVAGRDGRNGALTIHRDADVYAGRLAAGDRTRHVLREGRVAWLQVARGEVALNGQKLSAGDGAAIEKETGLTIEPVTAAEVLLFDMAA